MTNVRKMMARLNPATCRFDIGRGGIPELLSTDIAGALGMVKDEFAREVFCAVWWPDGARLVMSDLVKRITSLALGEYSRRCQIAQMAKLDAHIAEAEMHARNFMTEHDRRALEALRRKAEATRRNQWPWNPEVYARLASSVLTELRHQNLCPDCKGIGFIAAKLEGTPTACKRCHGTGQAPAAKTERARMLGISESAYRSIWRGAYEWVFDILVELEMKAGQSLLAALSEDEEAAA